MLLRSRVIPLHDHKVPRLEFLTCLKVVPPKVPNGLKPKASLRIVKGILKRKRAKIFPSRLLELSLKKTLFKLIFEYLIPEVCMTTSRKGASSDLLRRLDHERSL